MKLKFLSLAGILALGLLSCKNKQTKDFPKKTVSSSLAEIPFPGGKDTSLPHLFSSKDRTLLSWVKVIDDSTSQLNYVYWEDGHWGTPKEIITDQDWFVNWADYPTVTENNGHLLAHFLKKSAPATFAYDINLRLRSQGSNEWLAQNQLHTDGTPTEHGFVTVLPYQDGSFFITWLDGRETDKNTDTNHEHHEGNMTIRSATVSSSGEISEQVLLDDKTCSCCQTTAAMTENGPVVLYRDRSDKEIRDIVITRRVKGSWTHPLPVHNDGWEILGCPVNGPKADALGNHLVVAWYTAANEKPVVKAVFSQNGGEDFDTPIEISGPSPVGRVDVVLLDGQNAIVSWMESINEKTFIKAMKVNSSRKKSNAITVAQLDGSRKTGFPQMTLANDRLVFAWTVLYGKSTALKTGSIGLESFSIME